MKNLFFSLAFLLVGTVGFANSIKPVEKSTETSCKDYTVDCSNSSIGNYNLHSVSNIQLLDDAGCTLTVDVTITKDGKSVRIKGTFHADGGTCGELLKSLIS